MISGISFELFATHSWRTVTRPDLAPGLSQSLSWVILNPLLLPNRFPFGVMVRTLRDIQK